MPVVDGVAAAVKLAEALEGSGSTPPSTALCYAARRKNLSRRACFFRTTGDAVPMTNPTPIIRSLSLAEAAELVGWAAAEGWNPGLDDAPALYAADPDGFIGAFVDERMVAGISAVAYGGDFGFIGLYICRPDARGRGYGRAVWDAGMAYLGFRTIGLDGVPEQQANYGRMGFRPVYTTHRWSGDPALADGRSNSGEIVAMSPELAAAVEAFDRRIFPAPRETFLAKWLEPPRTARILMRGGEICGYGVARRCGAGYKSGPLFAVDIEGAAALLGSLTETCGAEAVHLDVPETQASFTALLEAAGMQRGFTTARMYRGTVPRIDSSGVFAVTTLELG